MTKRTGTTDPDPEARYLRHVAQAIRSRFPDNPDLASVALALGTQARTLQRRLSATGLSFQQILDLTRSDIALRLLEEGSLPIGEIARRLGYRDPAHFTRAFRRWTGRAPSEYR